MAMLLEELTGGPRRRRELEAAARRAGVGWRTVERAKARLGVRNVQVPVPGRCGPGFSWWVLPEVPLGVVPDDRRTA